MKEQARQRETKAKREKAKQGKTAMQDTTALAKQWTPKQSTFQGMVEEH
jgi:hypothetical protein